MAEYYGGWSMVKHNSALDLVRYYFLPNVSLPDRTQTEADKQG
jgi:hypothetical protein